MAHVATTDKESQHQKIVCSLCSDLANIHGQKFVRENLRRTTGVKNVTFSDNPPTHFEVELREGTPHVMRRVQNAAVDLQLKAIHKIAFDAVHKAVSFLPGRHMIIIDLGLDDLGESLKHLSHRNDDDSIVNGVAWLRQLIHNKDQKIVARHDHQCPEIITVSCPPSFSDDELEKQASRCRTILDFLLLQRFRSTAHGLRAVCVPV